MSDALKAGAMPPGEYAIVELLGHCTLVGRIEEVERFGTKMLAIEPLFQNTLLQTIFHGGSSIYRLTPCSAETAFDRQPRETYQLPAAVRAIIPPLLIAAASPPATAYDPDDDDGEDDGRPF